MKEFLKKNILIIAAFSLPIAFIGIVALNTYLPSLFLTTNYNFIYTTCAKIKLGNSSLYNCIDNMQKRYSVIEGKLVVTPINQTQIFNNNDNTNTMQNNNIAIFLHDTEKNESKEITLEEAQKFTFHELLTSPDGVTVSPGYRNTENFFFIHGGYSSDGYYLKKGKKLKKLNIIGQNERYYDHENFKFIGWIIPGRNK